MQHLTFSLLKNKQLKKGIILCMCCILVGCGKHDLSDLEKYIKSVKSKPRTPIEPLPERKTVESFVFNTENQRDPFKPLEQVVKNESNAISSTINTAQDNGIHPDFLRHKEDLEAYSLDSLRMVGTVKLNSTLWALISTNDKTIYRAKEGNYMGKNYGKVIHITPDKIEVMEIVSDKQPGTWREKQVSIALMEPSVRNKK